MRDIELEPLPDDPDALPSPTVGDDAFARLPPGGVNAAVALVDTTAANDKAYVQPGPGGELSPVRCAVVGGPTDGGLAEMAAPAAGIAPPALVIPTVAYAMTGRSANQATRLNLFPWFKSPREGMDTNNPAVVPGARAAPPPPPPEPEEPEEPDSVEESPPGFFAKVTRRRKKS